MLRSLTSGLTAALNAPRLPFSAAGASAPVVAGRSIDVNQIPFSLFTEVQNDSNKANRAVCSVPGWSATQLPAADCSHGKLGDSGWQTYCRVTSPQNVTLGKDGLRSITEAFAKLRAMGASPGRTGAMRLYISQDLLDDRATTNLMKMVMANEDILYRLGQNGTAGRPISHKLSDNYAISIGSAITGQTTASGLAAVLRSHHYGVNSETAGKWEFRFLDSSTDGSAVAANVQLLLGMVKAAIEDRGDWREARPASTYYNTQVDRRRWNAFMNATVGSGAVRHKLEELFRASGGQLEKESLAPEARNAVSQLMQNGYSFRDEAGNLLANVDALGARINNGQGVQVTLPQGGQLPLTSEQIPMFAYGETGAQNQLSDEVRAEAQAAGGLRERGVELTDAHGVALSPMQAAVLSTQDGQVFAARAGALSDGGRGVIPIGVGHAMRMAEVLALDPPDNQNVPEDLKLLGASSSRLAADGYSFGARADGAIGSTMHGASTVWRAQIGALLRAGELILHKNGRDIGVGNSRELHDKVLLPARLETLSADDRQAIDAARQLADRGFSFGIDGAPPAQKGSLGFIDAVTSPTLVVHTPQASHPTPLPTRALLQMFVRIEGRRDGELDAPTRRLLEVADELKDKYDYRFFNKRTEDEVRSRSGIPLSLATPEHKLMMRSPHTHRKTRVSAHSLENILYYETGQRDRMDALLRQCVERAEQLKTAGYKLEMKDIMHLDDNLWVEPTMPDLIATLEGGRRIAIVLPDGKRSIGAGAEEFLEKAERRLNPQPEPQVQAPDQPAAHADGWLVQGGGNH